MPSQEGCLSILRSEIMWNWILGVLRFLGLVLICTTVAVFSVYGLSYRISPPRNEMVVLYQISVEGTGKNISELYNSISPEGPLFPYQLMCATKALKGSGYSFENVIFPAWFYPGSTVSNGTFCSLDGQSVRDKFPDYQEIGS